MKTKLKTLLHQLLQSPRQFPVEAALGVAFFFIALFSNEFDTNGNVLWFFVPLLMLSFWLQRVNLGAYYASFFIFLPLMVIDWAIDLEPFLRTYGFGFTYVLAGILLIVGNRRLDNRAFAANALHVATQLFFGLVISGILTLAVLAIVWSFFYIFGIDGLALLIYTALFIWFVLAPQVCFTLIRQPHDLDGALVRVLSIILNYILSPAIVVYTVILYAYFLKILFEWNLPKGGVAWLVMGFVAVALVGRVAQSVLKQRYFDWFYNRFTLIALPPLVMYWIGSLYRISLYGFTESRFYLLVAGLLMTLFVLMLCTERTGRYQLMVFIFAVAIVVFTYIPGISAKSIGLRCQQRRLSELVERMQLLDAQTGKLNNAIDLQSIVCDPALSKQYRDVTSIIRYVRRDMGDSAFMERYGEWTYDERSFYYWNYAISKEIWYKREHPVDLGAYTIALPNGIYYSWFDGNVLTIRDENRRVVMEYPINSMVQRDTSLLRNPQGLFVYSNDTLLLVLNKISIGDSVLQADGIQMYRKPKYYGVK